MSGHSILYLGRGEFAADYLAELETLPCCTLLIRGNTFEPPDNTPWIDIVLYSGPQKKINFGHIEKAAVAFAISIKSTPGRNSSPASRS